VVASAPANSEMGLIAEPIGLRVEPEDGAGFAAAVLQLEGEAESLEQPQILANSALESRNARTNRLD